MGRWTAKARSEAGAVGAPLQASAIAAPALASVRLAALAPSSPVDRAGAAFEPPARPSTSLPAEIEELAQEYTLLLESCALSEAQRSTWATLSAAVVVATPPATFQKGPPPPELMAAMQAARQKRDAFIVDLAPDQKQDVSRLLDLEKRERKLLAKIVSRAAAPARVHAASRGNLDIEASSESAALKEKQKAVMSHAFWLYQQDRQKEQGTKYIDSTEWKRARARGGEDPLLWRYIQRAGWDASWPLPESEGRAVRREQHAKIKAEKGVGSSCFGSRFGLNRCPVRKGIGAPALERPSAPLASSSHSHGVRIIRHCRGPVVAAQEWRRRLASGAQGAVLALHPLRHHGGAQGVVEFRPSVLELDLPRRHHLPRWCKRACRGTSDDSALPPRDRADRWQRPSH
mmetsp:Transcript_112971/g.358886  ORF Transcript_112971/g.358886 Transcript_112971/m.358886 type:complete len:402 (-) Transcript_112971:3824-5029(-)